MKGWQSRRSWFALIPLCEPTVETIEPAPTQVNALRARRPRLQRIFHRYGSRLPLDQLIDLLSPSPGPRRRRPSWRRGTQPTRTKARVPLDYLLGRALQSTPVPGITQRGGVPLKHRFGQAGRPSRLQFDRFFQSRQAFRSVRSLPSLRIKKRKIPKQFRASPCLLPPPG
jgi:hypothetical protein